MAVNSNRASAGKLWPSCIALTCVMHINPTETLAHDCQPPESPWFPKLLSLPEDEWALGQRNIDRFAIEQARYLVCLKEEIAAQMILVTAENEEALDALERANQTYLAAIERARRVIAEYETRRNEAADAWQ